MQPLVVVLHLLLKRNMDLKSPMEREISISYFSASDLLDIQSYNKSDATIKAAVEANLAAQIQVGFGSASTSNDTTVSADEFAVDYSNGVLTITNSEEETWQLKSFLRNMVLRLCHC